MDKGIEALIADIRLKHGAGDAYAPILRWDEFEMLASALEQAQQENKSQLAALTNTVELWNEQRTRIAELENTLRGTEESLIAAVDQIAELESAPNGMMQLSNELAEMLVEKLPAPMNVKMGGDAKTKAMFSGMNMMLEDCKKVIRAAGGTVEGE